MNHTHTHTHLHSLHIDLHIDSRDIKALMLLIIPDYVFSEASYDSGEVRLVSKAYEEQRPVTRTPQLRAHLHIRILHNIQIVFAQCTGPHHVDLVL